MPNEVQIPRPRWWTPRIRYVVTVLGMVGCSVDYLVRYGLSVAIVAMVNNNDNATMNAEESCPVVIVQDQNNDTDTSTYEEHFNWSGYEQSVILGTFFWGYFMTKSSGGRISELFGAREVMAVSLFSSGILSMMCPFMAHVHPLALAGVRFFMGLVQGPAFPALYFVIAKWAPPDELATMVTVAYSGMSVGSLIALGGSGYIVSVLGWQWVFYGGGILAILWTPLWLFFVTNDPQQHPYISKYEQELLLVNESIQPKHSVPWRKLMTCWRYYPSILGEVATSWLANITTTEGPTFLTAKFGMNMNQVSRVLTTMQIGSWIGAFTFGRISDNLNKHLLSKLNTRRVIHCSGTVLITMGTLGIVLSGCNSLAVSAMMVILTIGSSCSLSTYTLSPMDIAPNYAGTLSGLLGIGNISGFVAPVVTNALITQSGSWASSILLAGGVYLVSGILYVMLTTTEIQDWNYYEEIPSSDVESGRS
ncbi:sialin-like isoform X1 [Macrobrachium rosenbergii]|uniref:sialin-like isoform X1 n=1 Tax=Macrobrachium rosenbergii TaxID=79674 RepID=UPI0034D41728